MKTRALVLVFFLTIFTYSFAQLIPLPKPVICTGGGYKNISVSKRESSYVGKINDSFEVSQNGLFSYEIPIAVPPGTGGMTPQLAINYTSNQSDGLLGSGFELSGLSVINRTPTNRHIDSYAGYVSFSKTDRFMLDGQRLIYSAEGSSEWFYSTENYSFSHIIARGDAQENPSTFTVITKSGLTYEYSSNTAPLTRAPTTAGDVSVFWLLTKVSDTNNNYYTVSYGKDDANGEYWPTRIDYTGNSTAKMEPYNSIRFEYTTNYTPHDAFVYGVKVRRSKIITGISVYSGEKRVRKYQMSYQTVNNNRQLTEYASDDTKKNTTKFSWYNTLNDSVLSLILEFNRNNDTVLVEKALLINDRMMAVDVNKEYEYANLYLRAQILYYLGRYKENFALTGQLINMNGSSIDKMLHKGIESKIKGKKDSVQYYLSIALEQCYEKIADSLDISVVYSIAKIYVAMDKKNDVATIIDELSFKYPEKAEDLSYILGETDVMEEDLSFLLK